jgi:hypothetical protein
MDPTKTYTANFGPASNAIPDNGAKTSHGSKSAIQRKNKAAATCSKLCFFTIDVSPSSSQDRPHILARSGPPISRISLRTQSTVPAGCRVPHSFAFFANEWVRYVWRGVPHAITLDKRTAPKSHDTRKGPPSPGLGFVKLDFLIGTKWGPTPGGSKSPIPDPEPAAETSLSERKIKTLPISPYSSKTWLENPAKVLIPKDRPWEGGTPITRQ